MPDSTPQVRDDQFIGISDPDAPIYRIFKLWSLEEDLRLRQLTLVRPEQWEDPHEFGSIAVAVNRMSGEKMQQTIVTNDLPPSFAQCWSATAESDTLLRAYSRVNKHPYFGRNMTPADEGVRVRSTPRKLLTAVQASMTNPNLKVSCFVGAVKYGEREEIDQELADALGHIGPKLFSNPRNRAARLLRKRTPFAHEAEIRLLVLPHENLPFGDTFKAQVDINEVFEEISFDPRLGTDLSDREATARRLGYKGPIIKSDLYQMVMLEVHVDETTGKSASEKVE